MEAVGFADRPIDFANAAFYLVHCKSLVDSDTDLSENDRSELSKTYAQKAIGILRTAKEKGLIDSTFLKQDSRFEDLKSYDQFNALISH